MREGIDNGTSALPILTTRIEVGIGIVALPGLPAWEATSVLNDGIVGYLYVDYMLDLGTMNSNDDEVGNGPARPWPMIQ